MPFTPAAPPCAHYCAALAWETQHISFCLPVALSHALVPQLINPLGLVQLAGSDHTLQISAGGTPHHTRVCLGLFFILNFYSYWGLFLTASCKKEQEWQWNCPCNIDQVSWENLKQFYYSHVLLRKPRCLAGLQHYTCVWRCGVMGPGKLEFSGSVGFQGLVTEQNT